MPTPKHTPHSLAALQKITQISPYLHAGCTTVIAEWCTPNSPQITMPSPCYCWHHTFHSSCRRIREKSIGDPQDTSNGRVRFQHLLWLMAKKSISESEAEIEAFSTLNVYSCCLQHAYGWAEWKLLKIKNYLYRH
jgi:hypothetical protein